MAGSRAETERRVRNSCVTRERYGWASSGRRGDPVGEKIGRYSVSGMSESGQFDRQVVVIGGGGHVGLPLAIAFADRGAKVAIYDISESAVQTVNSGRMPFAEPGAQEILQRVRADGRLEASTDPAIVSTAEHVVVVIGTPVDEHLNPNQA